MQAALTPVIPRQNIGTMNVIVANDFAHVNGGAAQVALTSAAGLSQRGHQVTLFAAVGPVDDAVKHSGVRVELTDQKDIKSDPVRLRAAAQGIWNPHAASEVRRLLSGADPENTMLHVHGWTKALSSSFVRAAIHEGISVVVTCHDYFYACPNGGFFNFKTKSACGLRPLSRECLIENCDRDGYAEKLWRSARHAVQNKLGFPESKLLHFITLSDFSEDILRPYLPSNANIYRVANPIDVAKAAPVNVSSNMTFVAVGRLSAEKGLTLLARAARDLNCEVTFVGDGPSRHEIASVYPRALITGWQSREQVLQHLHSARALVLPSLWYEAQPLVVAEAAALGIPAIVPDNSAAREMVDDGVTGLYFRSGDHVDLSHKMAALQNSDVATRMGSAAYDRYWADPLTLDKHLDALEQCYSSILAARAVN